MAHLEEVVPPASSASEPLIKQETADAPQKADVAAASEAADKASPAGQVDGDVGGGLFDEDEPVTLTAPIIVRDTTSAAAAAADLNLYVDDWILMSLLDAAMPPGVEDRHRDRAFGGTQPLNPEDFKVLQKDILAHLLQSKKLADRFKSREANRDVGQRSDSVSRKYQKDRVDEGRGIRKDSARDREERKSRLRSRSRSRTRQEKRRQGKSPDAEIVRKKSPPSSKRSVSPTSARHPRTAAESVQVGLQCMPHFHINSCVSNTHAKFSSEDYGLDIVFFESFAG
jgi:hypothetical protein